MRVVFLGTPPPAAAGLSLLLASRHAVAAVVTQPDRPRGRSGAPQPSAVKLVAAEHGLPVLQPADPRAPDFASALREVGPDVLAVIAYGHILSAGVLAIAPAVNVHYSLLPAYRGAAPVQRALMDGARETGVTTFLLEPSVDAGPILLSERVEVGPDETAGELLERLTPIGARLLVHTLDGLEAGTLRPVPQEASAASRAPKIRPQDVAIDWTAPAEAVANLVRAANPAPGAWTTFRGRRLIVWRARRAGEELLPGEIHAHTEALLVGCGDGSVDALEVQPEGKRRMSGREFARGYRPEPGDRLGESGLQ